MQQQANQLTQYRQFDNPNITQTLTDLTSQNTPPQEIYTTLWQLKQESEAIESANRKIKDCEQAIQKAKNRSLAVIGGALAIVVIFILVLILR